MAKIILAEEAAVAVIQLTKIRTRDIETLFFSAAF